MTIPLFKSHYSIGKSILTLKEPTENPEGADSIFEIAHEEKTGKPFFGRRFSYRVPRSLKRVREAGVKFTVWFAVKCVRFTKGGKK